MKLVIAVSTLINPRRCLAELTASRLEKLFQKDGAVVVSKKKKKRRRGRAKLSPEEGIHNTSELPIDVPSISEPRCN